jgi:hypothetical protein
MPAISGSVFPLYPMKNGISNSIKGMPQKDFTSDAENSFAMVRSQYVNTLGYKTNTSIPSGSDTLRFAPARRTAPQK